MNPKAIKRLENALTRLQFLLLAVVAFVFLLGFGAFDSLMMEKKQVELPKITEAVSEESDIKDGVHLPSGLVAKGDYELVVQNCLACHSSKLITQNRMTTNSWIETIEWMQETQNLWELGDKKQKIAAYLGEHYAPKKIGRRKALKIQEWYKIE